MVVNLVATGVYKGIIVDTALKALIADKEEKLLSVAPDELIATCVTKMNAAKVGAVLVIDKGLLAGIFTERDVLTKVIGTGIDSKKTSVSEVMTKNPITVSPEMTVSQAMYLITEKRFRHLPVMVDKKVVGLISSGDLTRWVVRHQEIEIRDLNNYIFGDKY